MSVHTLYKITYILVLYEEPLKILRHRPRRIKIVVQTTLLASSRYITLVIL